MTNVNRSTTIDVSGSQLNFEESFYRSHSDSDSECDHKLIFHFCKNEVTEIKAFLTENQDLNIFSFKKKDNNLLHIACLNNHYNLIQILFNFIDSQRNSLAEANDKFDYEYSIWLDERTDEGFTPLHFAAFRGNIKIIQELENRGACISAKNNQGLNVIHISAQGDQPISLVYFKEKGMDLNSIDKKGSTPVHWAAYLGCENAVNFLTSWECKLNERDTEGGLTPLHLSVISANYRVVRRLLVKGADRNLRDKNNKTAADLAKENNDGNFNSILDILEKKRNPLDLYNIRPISHQPKKKIHTLLTFIFLFASTNGTMVLFIYPCVNSLGWIITHAVIAAATFLFFLLSWIKEPGFLRKYHQASLLGLLQEHDPQQICPQCQILKPPRSKHCEFCNSCVSVYDHHCPWINNCVGASNHKYFILFVLFLTLNTAIFLIMVAFHFFHRTSVGKYMPDWSGLEEDKFFIFKAAFSGCAFFLCLIFIGPLIYLLYVQITNFLLNKTTSERYSTGARNESRSNASSHSMETSTSLVETRRKRSSQLSSVSCGGYVQNCYTMCCLNSRNRAYDYSFLE